MASKSWQKYKKTENYHAQYLGLQQFLLDFEVNLLRHLNFNSKYVQVGVKSLIWKNFPLNSIQAIT